MQAFPRDEAQARKARIDGEIATVEEALKNSKPETMSNNKH